MTGVSSTRETHRVGGAALLLAGIVFLLALVAFPILQPPRTPEETLRTPSLAYVTAIFAVGHVLLIPGLLGLYQALREGYEPSMLTAVGLWGAGIFLMFVTDVLHFSLISLSAGYAAASGAAQQTAYIVAADLVLSASGVSDNLGASFLLLGVILAGLAMVRGPLGRLVGYLGVATGIVGIPSAALFAVNQAFLPAVLVTAILLSVWLLVTGWKLYHLLPEPTSGPGSFPVEE